MNVRMSGLFWIAAVALVEFLGSTQCLAFTAYITNAISGDVSVIDTATKTVIATIPTPARRPEGVAVTPDGRKVYVASSGENEVSVIETATNLPAGPPIPVGKGPFGVAVTPDGSTV